MTYIFVAVAALVSLGFGLLLGIAFERKRVMRYKAAVWRSDWKDVSYQPKVLRTSRRR